MHVKCTMYLQCTVPTTYLKYTDVKWDCQQCAEGLQIANWGFPLPKPWNNVLALNGATNQNRNKCYMCPLKTHFLVFDIYYNFIREFEYLAINRNSGDVRTWLPAGHTVVSRVEGHSSGGHQGMSPSSQSVQVIRLHLTWAAGRYIIPPLTEV